MTLVSAVIPTIGRPELRRAVASVRAQTQQVHPIVVLDRPSERPRVEEMLRDLPHTLISTSGSVGGAAARNLGVEEARTPFIAYLDDDDEWLPNKTALQVPLIQDRINNVALSRAVLVGRSERVVPTHRYDPTRPLIDYLIERRQVRLRGNFMQSSMLLLHTKLAMDVPWRSELPRHQDWTLFLDLERHGAVFRTTDEPLVRVHQGSSGSVSRSKNWAASEDWITKFGHTAGSRARGDFLAAVAVRSAIADGDWRNVVRLGAASLACRPHLPAVVVASAEIAATARSRIGRL